jgi:hypothetical protein
MLWNVSLPLPLFPLPALTHVQAHLGAYEGIHRSMIPKPDLALLGAPGVANLNGRPFTGSGAEFLKMEIEWLGHPERVSWCLHDET